MNMADLRRSESLAASDFERMLARLAADNLALHAVDGDGNCQFRALAHFCKSGALDHARIRREIVDFIEENKDLFAVDICFGGDFVDEQRSVEQYCADMRRMGTWGDGTTLMAFCLLYNVNVRLYSADGCSDIYPNDVDDENSDQTERPTVCMVRCGTHYDATDKIVSKKRAADESR